MAKAKKHNEKKMEAVVDFGNITVPTKWEDVTLQMMSDYLKLSSDKEEQKKKDEAEAKKNGTEFNENDEKYSITDKDLLSIFTNFDMEKYDILPVELYESIMSNFSFVIEPMPSSTPSNRITYNGINFIINDKETLKVKEYEDAELVLRTDRFDYPSLLAILCREVTGIKTDHVTGKSYEVNEVYDSEFANKKFDGRREMFANMPITKVMPLITFFFLERDGIQQLFPNVYSDNRPPIRRTCGEYGRFSKKYGFTKIVYDTANDDFTKIKEINQEYLIDFLSFVSYEVDHSYAQKAQMDWEDQQRMIHNRR